MKLIILIKYYFLQMHRLKEPVIGLIMVLTIFSCININTYELRLKDPELFLSSERNFNSFLDTSEEAVISRLYGGIHYIMAINNGVTQGEQVGKHVMNKIQTRITN
jgi:hypothetical protein